MSFSHREEQRGDRLLDILTNEEEGVRLTVSRLGAELVSLARRDAQGKWIGFLYRDGEIDPPAKGWANHATVMGYYLHRLKDGKTLYRGKEMRGGTHSFLRGKVWALAAAGEGSLTYRITPDDFESSEYPLKVSLDLTYAIEGENVRTTFHFRNAESASSAHVGFGLHPGFAATAFDSFTFQMHAGVYRRHFAPENFLSGETRDIDFAGGQMPFAREQLPGSFIVEIVDVKDRTFIYRDPPSHREVRIDLSECPYLTLWSNGDPFLCVEPCWGLTDRHEQRSFENKEGIRVIPPLGELRASFTMRPGFFA